MSGALVSVAGRLAQLELLAPGALPWMAVSEWVYQLRAPRLSVASFRHRSMSLANQLPRVGLDSGVGSWTAFLWEKRQRPHPSLLGPHPFF